jgi:hypothetical protein
MLVALAVAAVVIIAFLVLVISALWDSGDGNDAGNDGSTVETSAPGSTDAATTEPNAGPEGSTPSLPATTEEGAATTVAPSPATTTPATTVAPAGGDSGTGTAGGGGAASGGSGQADGGGGSTGGGSSSGTGGGSSSGRSVEIVGSTGPCKFGDRCLIAGFTAVGFPSGEKEYVCEFADGSRYTFKFESRSVGYACATGQRPDSITIEVEGVRSDTIRTG